MPSFPIVDSHMHLWDPERFPISWVEGNDRLNRRYALSSFRADVQAVEIAAMVYVQVDVDPAYALLEARRDRGVRGRRSASAGHRGLGAAGARKLPAHVSSGPGRARLAHQRSAPRPAGRAGPRLHVASELRARRSSAAGLRVQLRSLHQAGAVCSRDRAGPPLPGDELRAGPPGEASHQGAADRIRGARRSPPWPHCQMCRAR